MRAMLKKNAKGILEFIPVIAFYVAYKLYDMTVGTAVLMVASLISIILLKIITKKIPVPFALSTALVGVFGIFTIVSGNTDFIKMKPTIFYSLFASIILVGLLFKKALIRHILGTAIELSDAGWRRLSLFWGLFFAGAAVLNEVVWRNFSEETWVNLKVFYMIPIFLLFAIIQTIVIYKYNTKCSK